MDVTVEQAAKRLLDAQRILILTHHNPDGDTLGSGFGLQKALNQLGKQTAVLCSDSIPAKFSYFAEEQVLDFEPQLVVAVDIADEQLLGEKLSVYAGKIDLCIDHHISNRKYAKETCLHPEAAATAEIMAGLVEALGLPLSKEIADPLYTGIATDTGCFKFSNTTGNTHRIAARLMEAGADYVTINRVMFDTKSHGRIRVEQAVLNSLRFYFDDRCAVALLPRALVEESGVDEGELDGVSALPRQVEGVEVGITLRERDGFYKISVRTVEPIDASEICKRFGGGGHARAAGCTLTGSADEVITRLVETVKEVL